MISELVVVSLLALLGLGLAASLGRQAVGVAASTAEARHLVAAAERAADSFFLRGTRTALGPLAAVFLLVAGAQGTLLASGAEGGSWTTLAGTALGALVGATATLGISYAGARLGLASAVTTVRAAQFSLDHATGTALRGAGAAALLVDAVGLGALVGLWGMLYLLGGGPAAGPAQARALLLQMSTALPGLAAGMIVTAIVLTSGGSACRMAAQCASRVPPFVEPCDPRSPAMVAEMVGEHVGTGVRRVAQMLATTTLATIGLILSGAAALTREPATPSSQQGWILLTLPLVARGIGVVATAVAVFASRLREGERPARALWRGQAAVGVLIAGGMGGASLWRLGADYVGVVTVASGLGVCGATLASHLPRRLLDRGLAPLQEVLSLERPFTGLALTRGLAAGLGTAFLPAVVVACAALAAVELGDRSGLLRGASLAGAAALASALSTSGFVLILGLLGPIADGARALSALEPGATGSERSRRATLLEDAAFETGSVSDACAVILGGGAALLAAAALGPPPPAGAMLPWGMLSGMGALGASLVASLVAGPLSAATRGAAAAVQEVERQLRGFRREGGLAVVPPDFTPSYRAVVDIVGRLSPQGIMWPCIAALGAPVALGIFLRLLYKSPGPAAEGVTAFLVFAAATGFCLAFAGTGARVVLGAAHRASRSREASGGLGTSLAGHSVGEFLGSMASPLTQLFVNAAAAAALLLAPALTRF